jgi:hypothetical protein
MTAVAIGDYVEARFDQLMLQVHHGIPAVALAQRRMRVSCRRRGLRATALIQIAWRLRGIVCDPRGRLRHR